MNRLEALEEIKAHICVARDNLEEAAKLMEDTTGLPATEYGVKKAIGDLVCLISRMEIHINTYRSGS